MRKTPPQLVSVKFSNRFYLTNTQYGFIKKSELFEAANDTKQNSEKFAQKLWVAKSVSWVT